MRDEETRDHHRFIVDNKASIWLIFGIMMVAATMMHPTGASLVALGIIFALGWVLRWVAHVEGRHGD